MNLQLIKNYCESRQGGLKQLAEDCNMSEANLHRCIRLNKIQASDLEKIASLLKVSVSVFFDPPTEGVHVEAHGYAQSAGRDINNGPDYAQTLQLKERVSHLEQRLRDKDATIAEKERLIQVLMKKI
jgi:DNA-binding Xre family transcriptional regulator